MCCVHWFGTRSLALTGTLHSPDSEQYNRWGPTFFAKYQLNVTDCNFYIIFCITKQPSVTVPPLNMLSELAAQSLVPEKLTTAQPAGGLNHISDTGTKSSISPLDGTFTLITTPNGIKPWIILAYNFLVMKSMRCFIETLTLSVFQ